MTIPSTNDNTNQTPNAIKYSDYDDSVNIMPNIRIKHSKNNSRQNKLSSTQTNVEFKEA